MAEKKLTPAQQEYLSLVDASLDFINNEVKEAVSSYDVEDVTGIQNRYNNELKNFINWCIKNNLPLTRNVKDLL